MGVKGLTNFIFVLPSETSRLLCKQQDANVFSFPSLFFFPQANDQITSLGGKLFIAIRNLVWESSQCEKRQSWVVPRLRYCPAASLHNQLCVFTCSSFLFGLLSYDSSNLS